jgi:hypothetical protein
MQPENYGVYTCEASLKHFPAVSSSIKIVPPGKNFCSIFYFRNLLVFIFWFVFAGPPIIITEPMHYSYYGHSAKIDYFMENEPKAQVDNQVLFEL